MSQSKCHIADFEKVEGSDRYVSVIALWPFWNPRRLRKSRSEKCCGEAMTVVTHHYDERCKVCGVATVRDDFRDFVHCRHCQHVKDVTEYWGM